MIDSDKTLEDIRRAVYSGKQVGSEHRIVGHLHEIGHGARRSEVEEPHMANNNDENNYMEVTRGAGVAGVGGNGDGGGAAQQSVAPVFDYDKELHLGIATGPGPPGPSLVATLGALPSGSPISNPLHLTRAAAAGGGSRGADDDWSGAGGRRWGLRLQFPLWRPLRKSEASVMAVTTMQRQGPEQQERGVSGRGLTAVSSWRGGSAASSSKSSKRVTQSGVQLPTFNITFNNVTPDAQSAASSSSVTANGSYSYDVTTPASGPPMRLRSRGSSVTQQPIITSLTPPQQPSPPGTSLLDAPPSRALRVVGMASRASHS
jgi:hypothetical protein